MLFTKDRNPMKEFRLVVWNIAEGGQANYKPKEIYEWTSRLDLIAESIKFLKADIVAIIDAFGWNKWPDGLFKEKFPKYRLEGLYTLGDIEDFCYAILVKKDIPSENIFSKQHNLFRERTIIEVSAYGVTITVAYLDANDAEKRKNELSCLLSTTKSALIAGDLNTIFINPKATLFGSIQTFFQHWRIFGLWLCSRQVREMFCSPDILKHTYWIPVNSDKTPSFPLLHFWTGFFAEAKDIKSRTAWLWRNFFFPCPVIRLDNVFWRTSCNIPRRCFKVQVVSSTTIDKASDHRPLVIDFEPPD